MTVRIPDIADILDEYADDDEIPAELAEMIMRQAQTTPASFDVLSRPWMRSRDRAAWERFGEEFS